MSYPMQPQPAVPPMPTYDPGMPPPAPQQKFWLIVGGSIAALILILVIVVSVVSGVAENKKNAVIKNAVESCGVLDKTGFKLGDSDRTLTIDSKGEDDLVGAELADAGCVLKALSITDKAMSHMSTTRAMDGRQTATWEGIDAAWSYHPDSGLDMTVSISDSKE